MPQLTDIFELERLGLRTGEGRRLELHADADDLAFAGAHYKVEPRPLPVVLEISRMVGSGYALRLRFSATVGGPCMRCLEPASPTFDVDSYEVHQPGGGQDLTSPYIEDELDLQAWARDALVLELPTQIVCSEDCQGLCAVCGENLNTAEAGHAHEAAPDPRWAKLSELKLDRQG